MENGVVLYEKRDPIGLVTINRPEMRNPLNMEVFRSLNDILDTVSADEGVRVVLVTGAGNSFVAGADINELLSFNSQVGWASSRYQQSVFNKLENLRKPSIAAINGFAMGGGLELALPVPSGLPRRRRNSASLNWVWVSSPPSGERNAWRGL
jgi:enoyl-CoA hydratase